MKMGNKALKAGKTAVKARKMEKPIMKMAKAGGVAKAMAKKKLGKSGIKFTY